MLKERAQNQLRHLPKTIWILGLVSFLTDLGSEMVTSTMPLFLTQELGSNALDIGWIEGIAEATASVTKIFSGIFSDWVGQRKLLVLVGYGLAAMVKPLFVIATSPSSILVARFADRVGKGIRVAPRDALVADVVTPENRGAAYGLRQTLDTAGAFLGPIVAFIILAISSTNFRVVFMIACIPGLLAIVAIVFGLREPRQVAASKSALNLSDWRQLPRSFWGLVIAVGIFNLGNSSEAFMILRAQNLGMALQWIPLTIVVMNFGYLLSSYPVGVLSDWLGRDGLLRLGWLLYSGVYWGFALVQSQLQVWGLFALYGLYLGMTQGILKAMVADAAPSNLRGTAFGIFNLVMGLMLLPASVLAGWAWQTISPSATFAIGTVSALLGMLFLSMPGQSFNRR